MKDITGSQAALETKPVWWHYRQRSALWILSAAALLAAVLVGWMVLLPRWSAHKDALSLEEAVRLEAQAESQGNAGDRASAVKAALDLFEALEKRSALPDAQKTNVIDHVERLRILETIWATLSMVDSALDAGNPTQADQLLKSLSRNVNPRQNPNVYWSYRNAVQAALVTAGDVPLDLQNGISIPVGESLEHFQSVHPGAECFDFEGQRICAFESAVPDECPGSAVCTSAGYTFADGVIDGVDADYEGDVWDKLLAQSTAKYGRPEVTVVPATEAVQMSSEASVWKLPKGYLSLVRSSGVDFRGNPIAHPFNAIYGSSDPRPKKAVQPPGSDIFKFDKDGLQIIVQAHQDSAAIIVKNSTGADLTISPSAVQIKTETDVWRPFALHDMSLLGIDVPGSSISVKNGKNFNLVANGFCGQNSGCNGDPSEGKTHIEGPIVGVNVIGYDLSPAP